MTEIIGIVEQAAEFIDGQVIEPIVDSLNGIRYSIAGEESEPCIADDGSTIVSVVEAVERLTRQAKRIADAVNRLADIAEKQTA
jgi:hypothetical protein